MAMDAGPAGRPFTRADLAGMPDDGRRYEIVDVLVGRREDFTDRALAAAPVLAVEVLSPSSRLFDTHVKRERFERAGTPAFWVVDPVAVPDQARLVAWELTGQGRYRRVADVSGEAELRTQVPFELRVVPADLVR
ncbi:MAG TPA: Uma2 family endonuclease [Micromonosporaceae bacterium]|nr:Uma2 family endonuclease [Micromonosporaceae bacterium]